MNKRFLEKVHTDNKRIYQYLYFSYIILTEWVDNNYIISRQESK